MTGDDVVARAEANFFGTFGMLAELNDDGRVCEQDGLLVAASGVPLRSFNNVFVRRPLQNPVSILSDVFAYLDSRKLPFRLRLREGRDQAAEAAAARHGLHCIGTIPELVLDPITSKSGPPPLEIRRATEVGALDEHGSVVADGFDLPASLLRQVFSSRLIAEAGWQGYVGYVDGQPVAASQLSMTGDVAGIYYVATLKEFRGRGFGEAMTWRAIQDGAKAGCDVAILQASDMGRPIYERMGFRLVAGYKTFVRPEFSGQ
jgi:ribosomal protein S18 acetylase RimI-like enzyme